MRPIIDHLQITVGDFDAAVAFYDAFLPLLGYDVERRIRARVEEHDFDVAEYLHPDLTFGINSPREKFAGEVVHRRRPGSVHHVAFRAESKEEVDRLHAELVKIDADIVDGPKLWPQHGSDYYAVFFKDPDGIKLEIVCDGDRD